ncbi:MAG: hypothetical protein GY808_06575, partial [Gammaproteobacteria bacterium]|nr:hypothetical protein [Gammaproteobacteria bacterium]
MDSDKEITLCNQDQVNNNSFLNCRVPHSFRFVIHGILAIGLLISSTITVAEPATGVTLSLSHASPISSGTQVTLTGAATGGSGNYEYQFWTKWLDGGGGYTLLQDFSTS